MAFLFWIFWIVDLLFCLLLHVLDGFRRSFTSSDANTWFTILLYGSTIGSFLLRFVWKKALAALGLAALPLAVLLIWYLIDSKPTV